MALKILPYTIAGDPDRLARFQREAEILAALNHPHIATIFGLEDGALAMEVVESETLRGPLPLARSWDWRIKSRRRWRT